MTTLHPGQSVRLSKGSDHEGEPVVIWSQAPGSGCYWAHLPNGHVVHIQVRQLMAEPAPRVTIREDLAP